MSEKVTDELRVLLAKDYVRENFESGEPWSETIARAILSERERCARIADAHALDFEKQAERQDDGSMHDSLMRVADGCELVADAIRTQLEN